MRIYLSGTRAHPLFAREALADTLRARGHVIVSRWHDPDVRASEADRATEAGRARIAAVNFSDLDRADLVLAVPWAGHPLRGAHVEIGYAIRARTPVAVLGDPRGFNTMTAHPIVHALPSLDALEPFRELDRAAPRARGEAPPSFDAIRAWEAEGGRWLLADPRTQRMSLARVTLDAAGTAVTVQVDRPTRWDPEAFQAAYAATRWWRVRADMALVAGDPVAP